MLDFYIKISKQVEDIIAAGYKIVLCDIKQDKIINELQKVEKYGNIKLYICSRHAVNYSNCNSTFYTYQEEFKMLYSMYEFTDKLILLSDNTCYPTLMNYVKQGILTIDEFIEAIIYKL